MIPCQFPAYFYAKLNSHQTTHNRTSEAQVKTNHPNEEKAQKHYNTKIGDDKRVNKLTKRTTISTTTRRTLSHLLCPHLPCESCITIGNKLTTKQSEQYIHKNNHKENNKSVSGGLSLVIFISPQSIFVYTLMLHSCNCQKLLLYYKTRVAYSIY